jgi:hypothetical protein
VTQLVATPFISAATATGMIRHTVLLSFYFLHVTFFPLFNRFMQKPPLPWSAITSSLGTLVIGMLLGYIFYATMHRIEKVEDDYQNMIELKKRAEDADVAKSQVSNITSHYTTYTVYLREEKAPSLAFLLVCSSWLQFRTRSELQ